MKIANYSYTLLKNFIFPESFYSSLEDKDKRNFDKLLESLEDKGLVTLMVDISLEEDMDSFARKLRGIKDCSMLFLNNDYMLSFLAEAGFYCIGYNTRHGKRIVLDIEGLDYEYIYNSFLRLSGQPWIIYEDEELVLRELSLDDLEDLYVLYENPSIKAFIEPLFEDRQKETEFQKSYIESMYGLYELGLWLIYHKKTNQLIGRAGIEFREYDGDQVIELGYMIADDYQGQGIASRICSKIIEYMAANPDYKELYCLAEERNKPSLRLAAKLGFESYGTLISNYMGNEVNLKVYRKPL